MKKDIIPTKNEAQNVIFYAITEQYFVIFDVIEYKISLCDVKN